MNKEVEIIEKLTEEFANSFGPDKACAILSSVICELYQQTDQKNAMVLCQPTSGVMVITTTMDAAQQIPAIVEKTLEQLPGILTELEDEIKASGEEGGRIEFVDGDKGEILGSLKPPTDPKKLN